MFFYKLYKAYKEDPDRWVKAWEFVGEMFIEELNVWVLMSYKVPANGAVIFFDNPKLIERRKTTGKSGAKYYEYRLAPEPAVSKIVDPELLKFYQLIKSKYVKKSSKKADSERGGDEAARNPSQES